MLAAFVLGVVLYPTTASVTSGVRVYAPPSARTLAIREVANELLPRATKMKFEEVQLVSETIVDEARLHGFDPLFIVAVIEAESNFDVEAVSRSGARGLMQLMPSTFRTVSDSKRMFDPAENVKAGIRYLSLLAKKFKKAETMLLAYNAGPGDAAAIIRGDKGHSSESSVYASKVMKHYTAVLQRNGKNHKLAKKTYLSLNTVVR